MSNSIYCAEHHIAPHRITYCIMSCHIASYHIALHQSTHFINLRCRPFVIGCHRSCSFFKPVLTLVPPAAICSAPNDIAAERLERSLLQGARLMIIWWSMTLEWSRMMGSSITTLFNIFWYGVFWCIRHPIFSMWRNIKNDPSCNPSGRRSDFSKWSAGMAWHGWATLLLNNIGQAWLRRLRYS